MCRLIITSVSYVGIGAVYFLEQNRNGTEVEVVAYLDCIHELVSIILSVFIGNTRLPGVSAYELASYNGLHAVAARQAGACTRLSNFAVHISLNHAYMYLH